MKGLEFLLSPPVVFLLFLAAAFLLYALGKAMAPGPNRTPGKLSTYACGEDIPGEKVQFGFRLFYTFALFFTIMHVAALVIATIPIGKIAFLALIYLLMIFLAIVALITRS
jgi:NADH-quinone oxidoreductase subunit A